MHPPATPRRPAPPDPTPSPSTTRLHQRSPRHLRARRHHPPRRRLDLITLRRPDEYRHDINMLRRHLCSKFGFQRLRPGVDEGFGAGVGGHVWRPNAGMAARIEYQSFAWAKASEDGKQEAGGEEGEADVDVKQRLDFGGSGGFEGLEVVGEGMGAADVIDKDGEADIICYSVQSSLIECGQGGVGDPEADLNVGCIGPDGLFHFLELAGVAAVQD